MKTTVFMINILQEMDKNLQKNESNPAFKDL